MKNSLFQRRQAAVMIAGMMLMSVAVPVLAQGTAAGSPITWLVGQPPGGTTDVVTRVVARQVERLLGQTVVIDNRPGAAGSIALQAAARAPKNGNTLITVPGPVLSAVPVPQLGKELVGVATLAKGPMVLVGTTSAPLPGKLSDLLSAAKADPKAFAFATSGNGTSQHLAGELMNQMAGTKIVHVPYKGGGQAVTDVVGGQVPLGVLGITPVLPHIKSGKLHASGVSTASRATQLPDTPTLSEAGLKGFDADQWFVVAAPAGTSPERLAELNHAIRKAMESTDVMDALAAAGMTPAATSPSETTDLVTKDLARWRALVKKANIAIE